MMEPEFSINAHLVPGIPFCLGAESEFETSARKWKTYDRGMHRKQSMNELIEAMRQSHTHAVGKASFGQISPAEFLSYAQRLLLLKTASTPSRFQSAMESLIPSKTEIPNLQSLTERLFRLKQRKTIFEKTLLDESLSHMLEEQEKKLIDQQEQFAEHVKRLVKETDEETLTKVLDLPKLDVKTVKSKLNELIKSSIDHENVKLARTCVRIASLLFPDNAYYKRIKEIIAPPKITRVKASEPAEIGKTISFLKKTGKQFVNKWIAVSDGQLLGYSDSYAELVKKFGGEDVVITRVA